jgi:hypothetical protein
MKLNDDQWNDLFDQYGVLGMYQPGLRRYLEGGVRPGGFLTAVLENNLSAAVSRCSEMDLGNIIVRLVRFLMFEAPGQSWGSPAAVTAWIATAAEERGEMPNDFGNVKKKA